MAKVKLVPMSRGALWIALGCRSVARNPTMWFVLATGCTVLFLILSQFGLGGALVAWLISPVFMGGLLYAARENEDGHPMQPAYLVYGFRDNGILWKLVALGGMLLVMLVVSLAVGVAFIGEANLRRMELGSPDPLSLDDIKGPVLIGLMLIMLVQLVVSAAVAYAVPLIMFDKVSAGRAMWASLTACVRNALPLLLFSVIYFLLLIAISLPLLLICVALFSAVGLFWFPIILGWLLLPPSVAMLYASYRDCFEA